MVQPANRIASREVKTTLSGSDHGLTTLRVADDAFIAGGYHVLGNFATASLLTAAALLVNTLPDVLRYVRIM